VAVPQLSALDRTQLAAAGIPVAEAERQLALLASPPPPARLLRPCTLGDGILALAPERAGELERRGRAAAEAGRLTKFVPASGAATRMFRALVAVRERGLAREHGTLAAAAAAGDGDAADALRFLAELPRLALAHPLARHLGENPDELARRTASGPLEPLLAALLDAEGLDAAALPKALLAFHLEDGRDVTAFEEQLAEGLAYLTDREGRARYHFTVPPGSRHRFEAELETLRPRFEGAGRRLEVGFSEQDPATHTLALEATGEPARDAEGRLLLRPSGHGALLPNLEASGGDLVVIKNIDNVLPSPRHAEASRWKLVLAGLADELAAGSGDRPVRVCGVVANTGEPGGGPFWVAGADGEASPQIVEASQIDGHAAGQRAIWTSSTHFNPVDLVVALRDPSGRPHDLAGFVDPGASFVTGKSEGGRELRVLERPGLWNGAMAGWRTVFVEVPGWTFAPVKTVLDLARPEHSS
jgi:DNA-binding transcriptional ArsR family regulator